MNGTCKAIMKTEDKMTAISLAKILRVNGRDSAMH